MKKIRIIAVIESARSVVESNIPFSISVVTYTERAHGMKNKNEFRVFQKQIRKGRTDVVHIDREISARAMLYLQEYFLSQSMMMTDVLIAATAVRNGEPLCTANQKYYRFVPLLELESSADKRTEQIRNGHFVKRLPHGIQLIAYRRLALIHRSSTSMSDAVASKTCFRCFD